MKQQILTLRTRIYIIYNSFPLLTAETGVGRNISIAITAIEKASLWASKCLEFVELNPHVPATDAGYTEIPSPPKENFMSNNNESFSEGWDKISKIKYFCHCLDMEISGVYKIIEEHDASAPNGLQLHYAAVETWKNLVESKMYLGFILSNQINK